MGAGEEAVCPGGGMTIQPWKKRGLEGKPDVFKALQSCQIKAGDVQRHLENPIFVTHSECVTSQRLIQSSPYTPSGFSITLEWGQCPRKGCPSRDAPGLNPLNCRGCSPLVGEILWHWLTCIWRLAAAAGRFLSFQSDFLPQTGCVGPMENPRIPEWVGLEKP